MIAAMRPVGEGLPPRLVQHPYTRPGYFALKVGGVLPSNGKACKAKGKGNSPSSCSSSNASGHSSSGDAGGGNPVSGRSIQNAPHATAQHGMSNSSEAAQTDLYISYFADGGMANQAISHWNAMATAIALGAKGIVSHAPPPVVPHMLLAFTIDPVAVRPGVTSTRGYCAQIMPPARVRTNWTAALSTQWVAAPLDGVWDIASFHRYAAGVLQCTECLVSRGPLSNYNYLPHWTQLLQAAAVYIPVRPQSYVALPWCRQGHRTCHSAVLV